MDTRSLNPNGTYYAYLRKSRADRDAEAQGQEETLARHQQILLELAERLGIHISKFYKEVVSGESISARPQIQELLRDIGSGSCDGVLVVEVERLARGDTSDQGTIATYFRLTNTLIITPMNIIDPNDEYDQNYFEFGLFMSRQEYKTINRRLQRGRLQSVKEGKWVASTAPYGYVRVKIPQDKGYTLEIVPDQAEVVRLIFDLFTVGELQADGSYRRLGHYRIAKKLDSIGIHPVNSPHWSPSSIKDMLRNPTYIGKVTFGKEQDKKVIEDGIQKTIRVRNPDYLYHDGLHPAIITEDQFALARELSEEKPIYPVVSNKILKNPLSGLVHCSLCGSLLTRMARTKKTPYDTLKCPDRYCRTVSSPLYLVEESLIDGIRKWFDEYKLTWTDEHHISNQIAVAENALATLRSEAETVSGQKDKAYDLLEQGVYTTEVFQRRMDTLDEKLRDINLEISRIEFSLKQDRRKEYENNTFLPRVEHLLDAYWLSDDAAVRNDMLKDVVDHVEYDKTTANRKGQRNNASFMLSIFPKLPKPL